MEDCSIKKSAVPEQESLKNKRFVKISERKECSDLPQSAWLPLTQNYLLQTWKGIHLDKSPMEFALYPMLLYELQPKSIIELGSSTGGSAVWLADHLDIFAIESQLYSIDIDLSQLNHKAKVDNRVRFLEGDCHQIERILPPDLLSTLSHPWLIIEDAHANLSGILDYFHHNGLQTGDYVIIEDTNKALWSEWSEWSDQQFIEQMKSKLGLLRNWLMNHQHDYLIDTYYQDMFGYNGSKNWNSILKKA